jgi:hypothetical protein
MQTAAMPADEDSEDIAETLLTEAVKIALEDERPKAVAAWLRRVATSVERGDYEE